MRIVKLICCLAVLGSLGLVATRSVHVDSDADQVRITIDRQKLRQAGSELTNQGRRAVGGVGQALERAAEPPEEKSVAAEKQSAKQSVFDKLFSR
jgi:hypothetical protein